jgi:cardiolipin synthase
MKTRLRKLFFRNAGLVPGNQLRLLQGGAEFFPALIAAIDAAHSEIHLETYIFNLDPSVEAVRDALTRAALRGVQVRLLLDGVGSRGLPVAWLEAFKTAGVSVLLYRPLVGRGWRSNPKSLRRLHRKLAVIDARIALVGGMNLIDDFEPVRFDVPRLDFSVEVQGPLLASIHQSARHLWRLVALTQLRADESRPSQVQPSWPTDGRMRAAFVVRDNFAHRRDIERAYLTALALAHDEIVLANAYFLPGYRFRRLLKNAAARGVRVHLLVQGHTDHPFFWPPRAPSIATCSPPASPFTNTRPASCTPRSPWSTATGPPWAPATLIRSACCSRAKPTSSSTTRRSRMTCGSACTMPLASPSRSTPPTGGAVPGRIACCPGWRMAACG